MRSLRHHAASIAVALTAGAFVPGLLPLGLVIRLAIFVAYVAASVVTWRVMRKHDHSLCEQCMTAMPMSPSRDAERYSRRLKLVHTLSNRRRATVYLAGVLVLPIVGGHIAAAAVVVSVGYVIMAQRTHRRLQPWCVQCANGGLDLAVQSPTPQLTPVC